MRLYINATLPFVLCLCLSSCSFNKIFFQPDVIPAKAKGQIIIDPATHDTAKVFFAGGDHQPVFIRKNDTVDFGYKIESVVFKSTSGNMLNGWFLKPRTQSIHTTIVHLHGNAGNLYSQHQLIGPLVKNGTQVFMFDYSGYGFSEGKPTKHSTLADALSAIDYLEGREDIKGTKLIIYGQSLGGHLSAVAAAQRQDKVSGLVIEGAFSSRKDIAAHMARKMFMPGFLARLLVSQPYAAKKAIRQFHKPLLVIHSTEDEIIPFRMGKTIFKNANNPKSFYEIKGPHIYGVQLYTDSIAERISRMP